jgi:hypothetical protein
MCPSQSADRGTVLLRRFSADGVLEYFTESRPVAETDRAAGTGALRFAGVCHRSQCAYWNDSCQLAAAVIPPVVFSSATEGVGASPCALRGRCRWHIEHGPSACGTCEAVTYTMPRHATVPVTVTVVSEPAWTWANRDGIHVERVSTRPCVAESIPAQGCGKTHHRWRSSLWPCPMMYPNAFVCQRARRLRPHRVVARVDVLSHQHRIR